MLKPQLKQVIRTQSNVLMLLFSFILTIKTSDLKVKNNTLKIEVNVT